MNANGTKPPKTADELLELRDRLLDDAITYLDSGARRADVSKDPRFDLAVATARKDMAFTVATLAERAANQQARQLRQAAGKDR